MQFDGQYLLFNEYTSLGGTLDEPSFNILEYNARKKIDERTFGRLIELEDIPEEVKICEYNLIKVLDSYVKSITENNGIKSEGIDGYSITYGGLETSKIQAVNAQLDDYINSYLANVIINNIPVLYRGVK